MAGFSHSRGSQYPLLGFTLLWASGSGCSTEKFDPFTDIGGAGVDAAGVSGAAAGGRGGPPAQGGAAGRSAEAGRSGAGEPGTEPGTSGSGEGGASGGGGMGGGAGVDSGVLHDLHAGAGAGGEATDVPPGPRTLSFFSEPGYATYDADPQTVSAARSLGGAQAVCLNANAPADCLPDALIFGFESPGWVADRSSIPEARWVWGPGIQTSASADLASFVFTRSFELGSEPSGTLSIVADDQATVVVNGQTVLSVGSVTDVSVAASAQSILRTVSLTEHLVVGRNTISVIARNGSKEFSGCTTSCSYALNPAGVAFGGTLTSGQ